MAIQNKPYSDVTTKISVSLLPFTQHFFDIQHIPRRKSFVELPLCSAIGACPILFPHVQTVFEPLALKSRGGKKIAPNTFSLSISNNTQKPDDEFIGHFQSTFAGMVPVPRWASHSTTWHSTFPEGSADSTASTRYAAQSYPVGN